MFANFYASSFPNIRLPPEVGCQKIGYEDCVEAVTRDSSLFLQVDDL
jgi:hypothetical protein